MCSRVAPAYGLLPLALKVLPTFYRERTDAPEFLRLRALLGAQKLRRLTELKTETVRCFTAITLDCIF